MAELLESLLGATLPSFQFGQELVRPILIAKPILQLLEQLTISPFSPLSVTQQLGSHPFQAGLELGRFLSLIPSVHLRAKLESLGEGGPGSRSVEPVYGEPLFVRARVRWRGGTLATVVVLCVS